MSKTGNRLVLGLLSSALAAGLLTSVFVRPEPKLTAAEDCYGPCTTATDLNISSPILFYGHEESARFIVRVFARSRGNGQPGGEVLVESGAKVLCRMHLHFGEGRCSPSARALRPGIHAIVAHYEGSKGFASSTSTERTVIVLRRPLFEF